MFGCGWFTNVFGKVSSPKFTATMFSCICKDSVSNWCILLSDLFSVTEARGEIQNFVHNFLENPSQDGSGHHQSEMEADELNVVEVVKEEHIVST